MNLGVSLAGVRGLPGGDILAQAFVELQAGIVAGWEQQHNPDGTHKFGTWTTPTFDASGFKSDGAAGNTWTVPSPSANDPTAPLAYTVLNKTMWLSIRVQSSTLVIATTPSVVVYVRVPDNYQIAAAAAGYYTRPTFASVVRTFNNGTPNWALCSVVPNQRNLLQIIAPSSATPFVSSTDFSVLGQVFFEIA